MNSFFNVNFCKFKEFWKIAQVEVIIVNKKRSDVYTFLVPGFSQTKNMQ